MRPVGYGRPGTSMVPDDWAGIGAHIFDGTRDCTVTIATAAGGRVWNNETKQSEPSDGSEIYSGPASIAVVSDSDSEVEAAEDTESLRRYLIGLPVDTSGLAPALLVEVTASPDADLVGQTLVIRSVQYGGRRFSRFAIATLND